MFEKEAVEKGKYYDWNCDVDNTQAERIWKDGAEFGYSKATDEGTSGAHLKSLEKENAELKKACNETQELLDKQIEATYKVVEKLNEAKAIIQNIIRVTWGEGWNYSLGVKSYAEQFLKE